MWRWFEVAAFTLCSAMAQTAGNTVKDTTVASASQNAFGLKLIAELVAEKPQRNIFVSPSSVFLALGMAEIGAAGSTRAAIRQTLHVPADTSEEELHASVSALSHELRSRQGVELSIANALWADRKTPLAPGYVSRCKESYQAEAITLDFRAPTAAQTINDWVKRETRNKIDRIVSKETLAAMNTILTNAIYFKGKWQLPFKKELTRDGPFHLPNGKQDQVPFMHQPVLENAYRSGDGYEGAVLPYSAGSPDHGPEMDLCVLLPARGKSAEEILAKVSQAQLYRAGPPVELDLRLPKFTLAYDTGLSIVLRRMGMKIAFDPGAADFTPMSSHGFFIGDVIHRTRLEVDEEGTVAAAVTAVMMPMGMAMPRKVEKKVLVVDRPFAVMLWDRRTGAILFAGVVYDPKGEME